MEYKKKIALVGNPNCGKTTLFNLLTGLNQKVGNFPGVTVSKKTGELVLPSGKGAELVDLPGTYGLSSESEDEKVVQEVLLNSENDAHPDFVLIIIDATNLKRNLFLATQVIDLGKPCVVALNMVDELKSKGISVDTECLEKQLGVPVFEISAKYNSGIEDMLKRIEDYFSFKPPQFIPVPQNAQPIVADIKENKKNNLGNDYAVYKILNNSRQYEWIMESFEELKNKYSYNVHAAKLFEINDRYTRINALIEKCVRYKEKKESWESKVERLVIHPVFGPLIFLVVFFSLFQVVFTLSSYPMEWITQGIDALSETITKALPSGYFSSFLVDGILAGIGGVVVFLPQIMLLFGFITILEDSGYLSRISFISDKVLSRFGMNGKSIIPLVGGFACAVPAIMATRNIENKKERLITMFITPLMSCSARLPVYVFLVSYIVPNTYWKGVVSLQGVFMMGLYLLGIVFSIIIAVIINKFIAQDDSSSFILELPRFKFPDYKNVLFSMWNKGRIFVQQAGKIILVVSILLWVLSSFGPREARSKIEQKYKEKQLVEAYSPKELESMKKAELLEYSYIGYVGKGIEPVIRPLGFDWKIGIALISSFAAREVFVGTMETIYSVGGGDKMGKKIQFSLPTALSLLIFYVFALQCMSTLAIVRQETGNWRLASIQFIVFTGIAYLGSWLTYTILT